MRSIAVVDSGPWIAALLCALVIGSPLQGAPESTQTTEQEITFKADDGWTIQGGVAFPKGGARSGRIPAVILLDAPMHNREIFGHNGYPSLRAALEKETIGAKLSIVKRES